MISWRAAFPRPFLQRCDASAKRDSPRAKRRVHYGPFGQSIGRLWRVHFLSGNIVQEHCGFLPCISDADHLAVFRGVHLCLHGSVYSASKNFEKLKHRFFVFGNLVSVRGAVSWQSVCELQRETRSTQNLELQVVFSPVSVNLSWGVWPRVFD